MKPKFFTVLSVLLLTGICFGQIDLTGIYSRDVRRGYDLQTFTDTLLLDTRVNSGTAVSRMTLVLRPGEYPLYYDNTTAQDFDSVEISLNFQLPTDFVADSMWLWIDGEPVEAKIQDRALASAQYNQIVGVRYDPALLEFSGNGFYNLRIFPARSRESRKIAIQFHHTFDDDSSNVITASIPLNLDTMNYNYYGYYRGYSIPHVSASFTAEDRSSYYVEIPGLGSGTFSSSNPLGFSSSYVDYLKPGTISRRDPSGEDDFLWVARDNRSGRLSAGITTELSESGLTFDPEPETRTIVLDIRNRTWDWNAYYRQQAESVGSSYYPYSGYETAEIWQRAQKFAILCLQNYVENRQKFNIIFAGTTTSALFDKPQYASPENISKAVRAILAANPSSSASTLEALQEAIRQDSNGIVILISDLFQPYDYYSQNYEISSSGETYEHNLDSISASVKRAGVTLFTIDDNWRLSDISYLSGGYRLGSILNRYGIPYRYEVVEGSRITIPVMPPLFGSGNVSGIRDIKVSCSGLSHVYHTTDGYSYNWWRRGPIMPRTIVLAKLALPSYDQNTALLRIAGQFTGRAQVVEFSVTGKMGGLRFRKIFTAKADQLNSNNSGSDVQWAFRRTESLAASDLISNAPLIKDIGKEYHIVTRQSSLLALEPWMKMWEDTIAPSQNMEIKVAASTMRVAADMADLSYSISGGAPASSSGSSSGLDLDGLSLEALAAMEGVGVDNVKTDRKAGLSVTTAGNMIRLNMGALKGDIMIQLYDLKGSLISSRRIDSGKLDGNVFSWNPVNSSRIRSGFYMLHVSIDNNEKVFRIPLLGR